MVKAAKRRLSVYPGQVSLVLNFKHAQEFHAIFTDLLVLIPDIEKRSIASRFLSKVESAITTGKRLNEKKSLLDSSTQ
jgi:hypothetical protein